MQRPFFFFLFLHCQTCQITTWTNRSTKNQNLSSASVSLASAVLSEGSVGITMRSPLYAKEIHLHINDSNLSSMKNVQRFLKIPLTFSYWWEVHANTVCMNLIAWTTVQGTRLVAYFRVGQRWSNEFPVYFLFQCGKINHHQHASAATVRKRTKCNARDTF